MKFDRHLFLSDILLPPSSEWSDSAEGWRLVRLSKGAAYWLGTPVRELQEGEVVVLAPLAKGCFRASQLGDVRLQCFHFCPEVLSGFLTVSERHYFQVTAAKPEAAIRFLPATHPAAVEFAALAAQNGPANNLLCRCQLMHIVSLVFEPEMARHQLPNLKVAAAQSRFKQLINEMPDGDLLKYTPEQLARLCGCSTRHFSRLFRRQFGVSIRAKQTELRLLKARQLLTDTDAKIIHVALESGYRHLGLFNSMFKKYLGMTPSEFRSKHLKKSRAQKGGRAAIILFFLLWLVSMGGASESVAQESSSGGKQTARRRKQSAPMQLAQNQDARATNAPALPPPPGAPHILTQPTNQTVNPGGTATFTVSATGVEPLSYQWRFSEGALPGQTNATLTLTNVNGGHSGRYDVAISNSIGGVISTGAVLYVTFPVSGYAITGNTLFQYSDLEPIFKKYTGPAISVENLLQAQAELQMAYRNRGYVTVSVVLPPQSITNGLVKIQVTEGRLAEINVLNNRYFSSNNILRSLPSVSTNIILNSLEFQQDLDRANGSRDRQIYPVIDPGPTLGTSTLNLKVKDRLPLHGRLEFNNYSTPDTPDLRINSAMQYNNLWQMEHQVGLQYSFSPEQMKGENQMPAFYDQPLVANYSGFYRLPLDFNKDAERGHQLGVGDFGYDEATKRFRAPPARNFPELIFFASRSFSDTGLELQSETVTQPTNYATAGGLQVIDRVLTQTLTKNEGLGFRFSDPLPAFQGIRSSISAGLDYKSYRSQLLQREEFSASLLLPVFGDRGPPFFPPIPAASPDPTERTIPTSVQYLPISIAWEASMPDPQGSFTAFNLNTSFNFSALFDAKSDFRRGAGSRKATGNYFILSPGLTREQKIYGDWAIRFHADGQWANEPLLSNEQFALGGLAGVRGYREGQEYGDTGWRVLFEPHTPTFKVGLGENETLPTFFRFSVFMDYGERYLLAPEAARARTERLWGSGFSITATRGEHFDVRLTFGVPLLDVPGHNAPNPRLAFAVSAQF